MDHGIFRLLKWGFSLVRAVRGASLRFHSGIAIIRLILQHEVMKFEERYV